MTGETTIYDRDIAGTRTVLRVQRDEDANLVIAGRGLGEAPMRWFGDSEYEYWIEVPASHAPLVPIERLRDLAAANEGQTTAIMDWLDERGIPHRFSSWSSRF